MPQPVVEWQGLPGAAEHHPGGHTGLQAGRERVQGGPVHRGTVRERPGAGIVPGSIFR